MTHILSLTIFSPLIGVAAILLLRAFSRPEQKAQTDNAAKWIALVATLASLALSVLVLAQFDSHQAGFQLVEDFNWFAGIRYRMGVDGISVLFVLLTTFLLPLCIVASWRSIETRVLEYLIAFLILEVLVIGVDGCG